MDLAHKETDRDIVKIAMAISALYARLQPGVLHAFQPWLVGVEDTARALRDRMLSATDPESYRRAEADYKRFWTIKVAHSRDFARAARLASEEIAEISQQAAGIVNKSTPAVYAQHYNSTGKDIANDVDDYPFFEISGDEAAQWGGVTKQSVSVKRFIKWNLRNFTAALVAVSLLRTDQPPKKIIDEVVTRVVAKNRTLSERQAGDMCTDAETKGQLDSMFRASDSGIGIWKQWIATLDNRTRPAHAKRDGEIIDLMAEFAKGLSRPRDPNGPPEEIENCRCRLVYVTRHSLEGAHERSMRAGTVRGSVQNPRSFAGTRSVAVPYMTYREWMQWRRR